MYSFRQLIRLPPSAWTDLRKWYFATTDKKKKRGGGLLAVSIVLLPPLTVLALEVDISSQALSTLTNSY